MRFSYPMTWCVSARAAMDRRLYMVYAAEDVDVRWGSWLYWCVVNDYGELVPVRGLGGPLGLREVSLGELVGAAEAEAA